MFAQLTVFNAFNVVSSREAARQPSSVDPPSHIPANAAMLLIINKQDAQGYVTNAKAKIQKQSHL